MISSKYILRLLLTTTKFLVLKIGTDSELYVLLSMITISCGVMADDLHCTIRWSLFGMYNHINPKTHRTYSPNQTHSHMTEPHYEHGFSH